MADETTRPPPVCPRCGTLSAGAIWCAKCGLNLRLDPDSAHSGAAGGRRPSERSVDFGSSHRGTARIVIASAAAALTAVAAVALALVLLWPEDSAPERVTATVPIPDQMTPVDPSPRSVAPPPTTTTDPVPVVSTRTIRDRLLAYITAYNNEDVGGLRRLFTDDLVRQNGDDDPQDLDAALTEYENQFAQISNPDYTLDGLQYTHGRGQASAYGRYTITSNSGSVNGAIDFHFVRRDGRLLIDQLTISPS
jgi:hypothetical protein